MAERNMVLSPPKKRTSRHFTVDDKTTIRNIFKSYSEDNLDTLKTQCVEFTVLREYLSELTFQEPKHYHHNKAILDNVCDGMKSDIRRLVHSFSFRNEPPTLDKIHIALYRLLKEMGFRWSKRKQSTLVQDIEEIVAWRHKYLRQIKASSNW